LATLGLAGTKRFGKPVCGLGLPASDRHGSPAGQGVGGDAGAPPQARAPLPRPPAADRPTNTTPSLAQQWAASNSVLMIGSSAPRTACAGIGMILCEFNPIRERLIARGMLRP